MRIKLFALALLVTGAVSCSDDPTSPSVSEADVRSAPVNVVINKQTIAINADVWIDAMPVGASPNQDSKPMNVVIRLSPDDAPVDVLHTWVVLGSSIWDAKPEPVPATNQWISRGGPAWDAGAFVDVVAQIRSFTGDVRLVRVRSAPIQVTY